MTKPLQRPVIVYYPRNVEPNERHPVGMLAGQTFESANPAVAEQYHPEATILRYSDGAEYDPKAVAAEVRALARETEAPKPSASDSKGSPRGAKGSKGTQTRKTSTRRSADSKEAQAAVKAETVAAVENEQIAGVEPETVIDQYAEQAQRVPDETGPFPVETE